MRGPDESGVRQLPQQILDVPGHLVRARPVRPDEPAGDLLGPRPVQQVTQRGGPDIVVRAACGGWAAAHGGPMPAAPPYNAANHPF
ncbi:hypothetical protein [Streptomyces carpaticus]|uniref:Uncharacterized protein n=1 Tax=Streptomyces carpaticus TaxID=285558 RepID=A0ABV4ZSP3_9ACTN